MTIVQKYRRCKSFGMDNRKKIQDQTEIVWGKKHFYVKIAKIKQNPKFVFATFRRLKVITKINETIWLYVCKNINIAPFFQEYL